MNTIFSLILAVEFIENNISDDIGPDEVAAAAFISPSHLYKLFSRVFRRSPMEYITKRRLCHAADALARENASVTELAFFYQYSSVESFSRAFKKQFNISPSEYRKLRPSFTNLYPKLALNENGGVNIMNSIKMSYNTDELSERLLSARGTYFLVVDIDNFKNINDSYSREAGDCVLAAAAARIDRSINPDMRIFRIGGDEFGVITGLNDAEAAKNIAQKIISLADEEIKWNDITLKFTLGIGIARIPEDSEGIEQAIKTAELAMRKAKKIGRNTFYEAN